MKKLLTGALALILFTTAAQAQEGRKEGKRTQREVGANLDLTEDQKSKMKELNEAQREEMKAVELSRISKEQQAQRRREIHQKYAEKRQALLTEEQRAKASAANGNGRKVGKLGHKDRGEFGQDLNLTQTQRDQMQALRVKFNAEREKVKNNTSLTQEQKKEQYQTLAQQHQAAVKAILTAEQLNKLEGGKKGKRIKAQTTK